MPTRKIFVVLILCMASVISFWLLLRVPINSPAVQKINNVTVTPYSDINLVANKDTNDDWKKILTNIDPNNQKVIDLTHKDNVFDDTTLTAQISRDFLSQYLLAKKGGKALTQEDILKISQLTLVNNQYTKISHVVYLNSNLHINPKTDAVTVTNYKNILNLSLKNRSSAVKENPLTILSSAINTENSPLINKLDPIILSGKGAISDLLNMEVPGDALEVHLRLLNVTSSLVEDLEAMKEVYSDPVRSFIGANSYMQDIARLQIALKNINTYLDHKLGTHI